jgi:hypothetical protein
MSDPYHKIYTGEIFEESQCIWHENNLLDFFRSTLMSLGYNSIDTSRKVWQRGQQKVVVCLVDDFSTCSENYSTPVPYLFDRNTTVITDNYVACPTMYQVCQLPASFFGIYYYKPQIQTWVPNHRFNFAVNRIDTKRLTAFLELQLRSYLTTNSTADQDLINFNCWSWQGDNSTAEGVQKILEHQFSLLGENYQTAYRVTLDRLLDKMPYRNHDLSQEAAHVSAWLNLVMETYSSDTTVALSEKTFRALSLPVPCMLYAGRQSIAYLRSLGFDTMSDIVEHRYDKMLELNTAEYGDKIVDFIFEGIDTVESMQANPKKVRIRSHQAAETNQKLLLKMKQSWPSDFAAWLPGVIEKIK